MIAVASSFCSQRRTTLLSIFKVALGSLAFSGSQLLASGQSAQASQPGFPEGFDGVQAAPNSHRVLFENQYIRVLEVKVLPGVKEPMHHHRWPSIFLNWDVGGRTPHQRYYRADGAVHDMPSREAPVTAGAWRVTWMNPEPMHSVENAETPQSAASLPAHPPTVRVEFKFLAG